MKYTKLFFGILVLLFLVVACNNQESVEDSQQELGPQDFSLQNITIGEPKLRVTYPAHDTTYQWITDEIHVNTYKKEYAPIFEYVVYNREHVWFFAYPTEKIVSVPKSVVIIEQI